MQVWLPTDFHIGETEWTKNGRYTSITEFELTDYGVERILGTGKLLVGLGKLIDPEKLAHVFISPRKRVNETSILFDEEGKDLLMKEGNVSTMDELAE